MLNVINAAIGSGYFFGGFWLLTLISLNLFYLDFLFVLNSGLVFYVFLQTFPFNIFFNLVVYNYL